MPARHHRVQRPPWVIAPNVPQELKALIWRRMAQGATDRDVGYWLDNLEGNYLDRRKGDALEGGSNHLDRGTIAKVREELEKRPDALMTDLPEEVRAYWRALQTGNDGSSDEVLEKSLPRGAEDIHLVGEALDQARLAENVCEIIAAELQGGRLGLLPSACRVFNRKGYYSRDRDAEIIVDVSIEVTLPGVGDWSLLWVWECIDYRNPVPVDDIEAFYAKLQQIGGVNIKGGVATRGILDAEALRFARSKGIAVIRLMPDDSTIVIYAADGFAGPWSVDLEQALGALTDPEVDLYGVHIVGIRGDEVLLRWSDVILKDLVDLAGDALAGQAMDSIALRSRESLLELRFQRAVLARAISKNYEEILRSRERSFRWGDLDTPNIRRLTNTYYGKALSDLEAFVAEDPDHIPALIMHAETLLVLRQFEPAAAASYRARELGADKAHMEHIRREAFKGLGPRGIARFNLKRGATLESSGRLEDALAAYYVAAKARRFMEVSFQVEAHLRTAALLERLDRVKQALAQYKMVSSLDPNTNAV